MTPKHNHRSCFFAIQLLLLWGNQAFAQTKDQIVKSYFEMEGKTGALKLNHDPLTADFGALEKATVFFVINDVVEEEHSNHGVLYDKNTKTYTDFSFYTYDSTYDVGVISVFFENLDNNPENEMIVLYMFGCRTFYNNGPYAGIKVYYQTRVFKCDKVDGEMSLSEYETIGDMLTVNLPTPVGTVLEEELIGRDASMNLEIIIGVTYDANQIKKRIKRFKKHGLLGGQ